jgi:hypothetical protein
VSGGFHIAIVRLVPGEPLGELARVRDRRGREHEPRRRPVQLAHAPQPPQHVRHVRAEDPAVDVRLVDDHELQLAEEPRPRRVVGQDPEVQHVGVGEDHVRVRPQR